MGLFGPTTVVCNAGEWTTIVSKSFSNMPGVHDVRFTSPDGASVEGEVEEKKTAWLFPQPAVRHALQPVMSFTRGWWNTFYSVRVKPARTVLAVIE